MWVVLAIAILVPVACPPAQASLACPLVTTVDYPLRPYDLYYDASPFLSRVWFEGTPGGCDGGNATDVCEPIDAPLNCADPSSDLTNKDDPSRECDYWKLHLGQDLNAIDGADCDDAVYAVANGEVIAIQRNSDSGFGNYVLIEHLPDPDLDVFYSFYAHLTSVRSDLEEGSCVTVNEQIGVVGKTGFANTCHLHFEMRYSNPADLVGRGYAHHFCQADLAHYFDGERFIRHGDEANRPLPPIPFSPNPTDEASITELPVCTDDRGTANTADDGEPRQCFRWAESQTALAPAISYDFEFNGNYVGRSWINCFFLDASLSSGHHEWKVTPRNSWTTNPNGEVWNLELLQDACVQSLGGVLQKTTCSPPNVISLSATSISSSTATVNLSVIPGGSPTFAWFRYGISSVNLDELTQPFDTGSGFTATSHSRVLSGLQCEQTYYFQAWADGAGDPVAGDILSFTTSDCGGGGGGGGGGSTDNLILNGGFEQDDAHWSRSGFFQADRDHSNYHDGPGYAYLALYSPDGEPGNNISGSLFQEIAIPSSADSATLFFWRYISTSEPGGSTPDVMQLTVRDDAGDFLDGLFSFSNANATADYVSEEFDLSEFIGETVQIHFQATTNATYPTLFRIDDVSLISSSSASGSGPSVTTLDEDRVDRDSARLRMMINPNGLATDAWFEWDDDTNLSFDTPRQDAGSGTSSVTLDYTLSGLDCGTTYYFEAFAENAEGQNDGVRKSFRTDECTNQVAPRALTQAPEEVTESPRY